MTETEAKEQSRFVAWCRDMGIMVGAIPNSIPTNSWKALNEHIYTGLCSGLPDLLLVIPAKYRKDKVNKCLFIEMKRKKGGVVSKNQKKWINALKESEGVSATVARGSDEAVAFVKGFLEIEPPIDMTFINSLKKQDL